MKRNKKLISFGSLGMSLAIVASVLVYSYHYSPKALADQLASRGIITLSSLSPEKMNSLQAQFGGNPADALKEAKAAKDLKIITKAEFETESKAANGVFATSLSSDPNAPKISMQSFTGGDAHGGSGAVVIAGTGTTDTASPGSVNVKEGEVTVTGGNVPPIPPDGPTNVVYSGPATSVSASGEGEVHMVQVNGTSAGTGGVSQTSTVPAEGTALPKLDANPGTISFANAVSYLRYTDTNGRVNVLSLDKDGLPIFRTTFMNNTDVPRG